MSKFTNIKTEFPLLVNYPELVYLDNAATTQKPQQVIDAIVEFYTLHNANVHRGIYDLSEAATKLYEDSRKTVADFLKVAAAEIIFTSGDTASANMIYSTLPKELNSRKPGIILTSLAEHHSQFLPLQQSAAEAGIEIKFVGLTEDYQLDYAELEKLLSENNVSLLSLSLVSNVTGGMIDCLRVKKLLTQYSPDCVFVVDAAQIVGHDEFYPETLGIDACFFSGHKMFAETGIGVLWLKSELLDLLNHSIRGGGTVQSVTRNDVEFIAGPQGFEAGTPHISGAISLATACNYLTDLGLKEISEYEAELGKKLLTGLNELPEIELYGTKDLNWRKNVFAFNLKHVHPHDLTDLLNDKDIAVRAGHHCNQILHNEVIGSSGSVRASTHIYNSESDVEKFISALKSAIIYFGELS